MSTNSLLKTASYLILPSFASFAWNSHSIYICPLASIRLILLFRSHFFLWLNHIHNNSPRCISQSYSTKFYVFVCVFCRCLNRQYMRRIFFALFSERLKMNTVFGPVRHFRTEVRWFTNEDLSFICWPICIRFCIHLGVHCTRKIVIKIYIKCNKMYFLIGQLFLNAYLFRWFK